MGCAARLERSQLPCCLCAARPAEEPEAPPARPAAPLPDDAPSTSGAGGSSGAGGGGSGAGGGITLQGDELKAFLAQAQAGGGLGAALGGAGRRPGGGPPQLEELPAEEGSAQPRHATVDDPEFSKYWKAPIGGGCARAAAVVGRGRWTAAVVAACGAAGMLRGPPHLPHPAPVCPSAQLCPLHLAPTNHVCPAPADCWRSRGGRLHPRQAAGQQVPAPVVPEPGARGGGRWGWQRRAGGGRMLAGLAAAGPDATRLLSGSPTCTGFWRPPMKATHCPRHPRLKPYPRACLHPLPGGCAGQGAEEGGCGGDHRGPAAQGGDHRRRRWVGQSP